ncbi:NACHT domain-containing protein [Nodosilinea nodulosa]|uniref:NACHT domain-containing protein n=1 Tax=Nodosilinea nodulosa TaxID=416001 RepID=UPI0002FC16E7|nr:hypothetical protein [Nodosilinea nodulosa]
MAVTPILLSLICWIYSDSGDFPEKRHKLYEHGLDLLLGTWDERRGIDREAKNQIYKSLSKTKKKSLLNFIAFSKFQEKQRLLFDLDEICAIIAQFLDIDFEDAHEVLSDIESQHGIIIERAQEIYSFSHLTFQEFFAAKSIIEKFSSDSQHIFYQHFGDRDWREVFLLVFSMLKKPDELLMSLKEAIDSQILNDLKLRGLLAYLCRSESQDQGIRKGGILRLNYLDLLFGTILNFQSIYDTGFSLSQSLADHPDKAFSLDYGLLNSLDLAFVRIREKLPGSSGFQVGKEFISSLEKLKSLLPQPDKDFLGWWHDNGHDWNQNLKETLDKHMGMSQYWQLTHQQKDIISTCLYSSQLLLNCIKISDFVSPKVQAIIEDNLLDF